MRYDILVLDTPWYKRSKRREAEKRKQKAKRNKKRRLARARKLPRGLLETVVWLAADSVFVLRDDRGRDVPFE